MSRRHRGSLVAAAAVVIAVAATGCPRAGRERAEADLEVGLASTDDVTVEVAGGLAAVRSVGAGTVELWAQAPALTVTLDVDAAAPRSWELRVRNCMPDAVAAGPAGVTAVSLDDATATPTDRTWRLDLGAVTGPIAVTIAPPDADAATPWRFAVLSDIQTALPEVDDIYAVIATTPGVRFVVSAGDITEENLESEHDLHQAQLAALPVPFFATPGNHELWDGRPERWRERYGRANVFFRFKATAFALVDSANSGIDPVVHAWIDGWLAEHRDDVAIFATHFPPVEPYGARSGAFRSRKEAYRLLARLAEGAVDLTLYGHIHTYLPFSNAGIPAYVSGGGGAWPERWDHVGRHFLIVDVDPTAGRIVDVGLVRVD